MPRPNESTDSTSSSLTANSLVNSLISGTQWESTKWYDKSAPTELTYSFINPVSSYFATNYSADNEYKAVFALTANQQVAVASALSAWSSVANIKFSQTTDTLANVGDLRFGGYSLMESGTVAWAYLPGSTPKSGDVWIGPETNQADPSKGSYDYLTFVHEIGHAIGLKHPFATSQTNSTVLDASLDDVRFTVMSYNDNYSYQPTTPMLLDILAIQSLYGANTAWQAGNTTYTWANNQSIFETIWDGGGIDTIDASNQLNAVRIDLNEGAFSQIGKAFLDLKTLTAFNEGLAIAYGAKIENAVGTVNDDSLIGNALDNILNGQAGADTMIGGTGNDTYFVDNVGDTVIETSTLPSEIDTVLSYINYTLGANVENLTLLGTANLSGTGNALNNVITGNWGQNTLDGGAGADTLIGGGGNDIYVVDNAGDIVIENSEVGGGTDTVKTSISYSLVANVENIELTGSGNLNANGNALNNVMTGNSGNNVLNGGAGLDTMIGGDGDDTYYLDQAGELALIQENASEGNDTLRVYYNAGALTNTIDLNQGNLTNVENVWLMGTGGYTVQGNSLDNYLLGSASADTLRGGEGNDRLDGAAGADTLVGGNGDDTYVIDNAGDVIIEALGEGRDRVLSNIGYTLSANVEDGQLLGSADLYLVGNGENNVLTGNSGNNILNGQEGADTMDGGAGNDTYFVDNVGDVIIENGTSLTEIDTVLSSLADYTLGANLENLTLRFSDNINGTGNALNNVLTGNSGDNILDGGAGADTMIGGLGNDTYVVDNVGDVIRETSTLMTEIDTVRSSINYSLGANVENIVLTGSANLNANGNALNNVMTGNSGNNVLNGGGGLDTMIGGDGDDTYYLDQAGELSLIQENASEGTDTLRVYYNATPMTNVINMNLSNLANVENVWLMGTSGYMVQGNNLDNYLLGSASADTLQGGAGNDRLDGAAGADTLIGGSGDDTYVIDNAGDVVIELGGEGRDRVLSNIGYTLTANVEDGQLLGNADLYLVGNGLDNVLTGNSGNNIINGQEGADTMDGGAGNDTYFVDNVGDVIIENGTSLSEIDTVLSSLADYTLGANLENLTLRFATNINGTGNALNNVITGNAGNNILDGGAGADTMIGGLGNDTYVVDNVGDIVSETSTLTNEIDTVRSSINYSLGANVENIVLTGSANLNANGNTLNNVMTGNSGNNVLNGGAGLDTMIGGDGDDTYYLDQSGELALIQESASEGTDTLRIYYNATATTKVVNLNLSNLANVENVWLMGTGGYTVQGNSLDNYLLGSASADTLQGGAGNDRLDGAAGADTLAGGTGDDTYVIDNAGDLIVENVGEGHDRVITSISYTLAANLEDAQLLGNSDLYLVGNGLDNVLTGNGGNNIINGQEGADTMDGGAGNDTYFVDNIGDVIIENGTSLTEIDTVLSSLANYTLGANLENLTLRFADNINGTGNALSNVITGNAGNNVLDGGAGADTMIGGLGNDTYVVDNAGDIVTETSTLANEIDTVRSSINYTLGANVENLQLTGSANLLGYGNALNNVLTGNDGNNVLNGGAGNDTLIGGRGVDMLTGGTGADTFVFNNLNEVGTGSQRDVIYDFSSLQGDKIDLSAFDANLGVAGLDAFTFIGSGDFTGAGQLRFADQVLSGNVSGNAGADFEIHLVGVNAFSAQDLVA
ncbi:M10 family metallopeptidase C-terminal domain-containing protein [Pseudomonas koreensis]|uniref:M10 family metallopeptidase C-terminal domain-containing protein n=1 Tax=Pseudomonas koreensis TaxID=198620 RepID=UPI0021C91DF5|nr:M10 family metallopeptidase C-terminal domain-containing protein [Pseudomonas koreensis]MCU0089894.1 M10 family metallopeptidase C-terminal domain-containing protein [Pseudomonas koreensis]